MNKTISINFRSTEMDHVESIDLICETQTNNRFHRFDKCENNKNIQFFWGLQDERDKTVHSFSDSDSKDSLSNTGNNGKKKRNKNGNKMLR